MVLEKMKLRTKMLAGLLLPMLLILSVISIYSYYNARDALHHQITQSSMLMTSDLDSKITAKLEERVAFVNVLASLISKEENLDKNKIVEN